MSLSGVFFRFSSVGYGVICYSGVFLGVGWVLVGCWLGVFGFVLVLLGLFATGFTCLYCCGVFFFFLCLLLQIWVLVGCCLGIDWVLIGY